MNASEPRPERFTRSHRLRHAREFQHVYGLRHRRESGPLLVYAAPNELTKVGGAVTRNRIKRRLRESFRRIKAELTDPFDYIVVVRPHKAISQADYQAHLARAMSKTSNAWRGKQPEG